MSNHTTDPQRGADDAELRVTSKQVAAILQGARYSDAAIEDICRDWLDMSARLASACRTR